METGRTDPTPDLDEVFQEEVQVVTVPVRGEGVFLTQALPARRVQYSTDTVSTSWTPLLPPSPKRSRATIVADGPVYVSEKGISAGMYLPAGVPYVATHRGGIAVKAAGQAGTFADPTSRIVPQPALGVGTWTVTVPAGQLWELLSVRMSMNTGAVVKTRIPELKIVDSAAATVAVVSVTASPGANASRTYGWWKGGAGAGGDAGALSMGLPEGLYLSAGWSVQLSVFNFDPADQLDAATLGVRIAQTTATVGSAVELWAD